MRPLQYAKAFRLLCTVSAYLRRAISFLSYLQSDHALHMTRANVRKVRLLFVDVALGRTTEALGWIFSLTHLTKNDNNYACTTPGLYSSDTVLDGSAEGLSVSIYSWVSEVLGTAVWHPILVPQANPVHMHAWIQCVSGDMAV